MCFLSRLFGTFERPSPGDWVPSVAISVSDDKIIIDLKRLNLGLDETPIVWIPEIPDTNSMDGVFDIGNNNILIAGRNDADQEKLVESLRVGDIAVYKTPSMYAIHRIVEINEDGEGKYFRFKGDNNASKDPDKVRPNQVTWVSVGTIY